MALTYRKNRWRNADNLNVYFPDATGTEVRGGHFSEKGENGVEVWVSLAELPATSSDANGLLLADTVEIPQNAWVTRVSVLQTTETTTTTGTVDIGLVNATTMAIVDANGLIAALDVDAGTDVGTYKEIAKGGTGAGALIGTKLAQRSLICGSYSTAAYTDGVVRVRVYYSMVLDADD